MSGSYDFTVKIWDIYDEKLIYDLKGHIDVVTSVNFLPGGNFVVSASQDETIKIWD